MLPFSPRSLGCWWLRSPEPGVTLGCPGVPVPSSALGQPVGIAAVPGRGGRGVPTWAAPRAVLSDPAAPELQCPLELRSAYKLPRSLNSLEQSKSWGVQSRAAVPSLSPSTCQTGGGCWSSLCNLLQPGTDASAELEPALQSACSKGREKHSLWKQKGVLELFITLILLPAISRICSCSETLPVPCDLSLE